MATPIDCRAYYIDSQRHVSEKSTPTLCQNLNNNNNNNNNNNEIAAGSGFSVSKYLIDRSGTGIGRNSANLFHDPDSRPIVCVVDSVADGARHDDVNAVATGNDVSTSGHAPVRSVRGRLRRVVGRLESLLRDMKVLLHDLFHIA